MTQRAGWAWCAAAAVLFGAATPLLKLLTADLGAFSLSGLLYLGAAAGALLGVLVMSTGAHDHEHAHEALEHRHAIDGSDPHRHAALVHSHPHVPDAHHRHDHEADRWRASTRRRAQLVTTKAVCIPVASCVAMLHPLGDRVRQT